MGIQETNYTDLENLKRRICELDKWIYGKTLTELETRLNESKMEYNKLNNELKQSVEIKRSTIIDKLQNNKPILAPKPNKGKVDQLNFLSVTITKLETKILLLKSQE